MIQLAIITAAVELFRYYYNQNGNRIGEVNNRGTPPTDQDDVAQLQDQEKAEAEAGAKNKVNQHKKFTPTLWANFDQNYQPINSGDAWTSPIPRDSRLIGHSHPNVNELQRLPSVTDMNVVNAKYFRTLDANPLAPPTPSRIFWGTGNTDNTIFWPGFGKAQNAGGG